MHASSFAAGTGRYRPAPAVTGSTPLVFAGTGRYRLSTTNGTVPNSSHRNALLACRTRCSLAAPAARLPHPLLACCTRSSVAAPAAGFHPVSVLFVAFIWMYIKGSSCECSSSGL
jgi:hypothetical protein